jgi:hypothetical protein
LVPAWRSLLASLAAVGCAPRVYGGYGWQTLTQLAYVHADSDLDLLLPVDSATQADEVGRVLASADGVSPAVAPLALTPIGMTPIGVRSCLLPGAAVAGGVRSCLLPDLSRETSIHSLAEDWPGAGLQGRDGDVENAVIGPISEHDARCQSPSEMMQKARPDPELGGVARQKARPDPMRDPMRGPPAMWPGPRLDGEMLFPDGAAIAWREWVAHREGRTAQVLVKRLRGVAMESPGAWVA